MAQYALTTLDTLTFVGLERTHLRSTVYRRVFGDETGPVRIGRYSLLERVGAGARGVVFKAFDNQLDRLVALKVLSARTEDRAELVREAKALARLSHPNVLSVYEVGETEGGQVFLATEYVKGWTLRGWFDEEHRSQDAIVEVMRQVALGVQAAHDEGLVHRDLKPANILVGEDGRVRVADFGLARFDPAALQPSADVPHDGVTTTTAGTPGYMAPELFEGRPASPASDQYALAVTLHELLHAGDTKRSRGVVANALERGLSAAPEHRFDSVADFAAALTRKRARRSRRRTVALGVALVGLGGAATAGLLLPGGVTGPDPQVALLRAEAALPEDPRAALDALAPIAGWDDDRVLETAERALMLGPEDASFELPEGSRDAALLGSLVFYRDSNDELTGRRLGEQPEAIELSSIGLMNTEHASFEIVSPDGAPVPHARFLLGKVLALRETDPFAFRALDEARNDFSLSGDGRVLARADDTNDAIRVSDAQTGETLWSLDVEPDTYIKFVRLDATGSRLAWGDSSGRAEIYDLATDVPLPLETEASGVLFEPDPDHVIVHGRYSGVFRTRLSDGHTVQLASSTEGFSTARLSPDGRWLAARSGEGITVLRPEETVSHRVEGKSFTFSADSTQLLTWDENQMSVYEVGGWSRKVLSGGAQLQDASFGPSGTIWSLWGDGRVRRHNPGAFHTLRGHESLTTGIALSKDGSLAVSVGRDYTLRRWDVDAGTNVVLAELEWELHRVTLDEDGRRVALPKRDDETYVFDLDSGEQIGTAPHTASGPVIGPGGSFVGAGKRGVWKSDGHTSTFIAPDLEECGPLAATADILAMVCGPSGARTLHVWNGERHDSAPMPDPSWGEALEVWPDRTHLVFLGLQRKLVSVSDDGIVVDSLDRELPKDGPFPVSTRANTGGALLMRTPRGGLNLAWAHGDEIVQLSASDELSAHAISADGSRVAYAHGNEIRIIDRELSGTHRDLPAVLEAHALVEGQL